MGFGGKDYGLECRASGSEGAKGIGGRRNLPFSTAPRHVCSWCGEKKMVGRLDVEGGGSGADVHHESLESRIASSHTVQWWSRGRWGQGFQALRLRGLCHLPLAPRFYATWNALGQAARRAEAIRFPDLFDCPLDVRFGSMGVLAGGAEGSHVG